MGNSELNELLAALDVQFKCIGYLVNSVVKNLTRHACRYGIPTKDLKEKMENDIEHWMVEVGDLIDEFEKACDVDELKEMGEDFARDRLYGDEDDVDEFEEGAPSYAIDLAKSVLFGHSEQNKEIGADLAYEGMMDVVTEIRKERGL